MRLPGSARSFFPRFLTTSQSEPAASKYVVESYGCLRFLLSSSWSQEDDTVVVFVAQHGHVKTLGFDAIVSVPHPVNVIIVVVVCYLSVDNTELALPYPSGRPAPTKQTHRRTQSIQFSSATNRASFDYENRSLARYIHPQVTRNSDDPSNFPPDQTEPNRTLANNQMRLKPPEIWFSREQSTLQKLQHHLFGVHHGIDWSILVPPSENLPTPRARFSDYHRFDSSGARSLFSRIERGSGSLVLSRLHHTSSSAVVRTTIASLAAAKDQNISLDSGSSPTGSAGSSQQTGVVAASGGGLGGKGEAGAGSSPIQMNDSLLSSSNRPFLNDTTANAIGIGDLSLVSNRIQQEVEPHPTGTVLRRPG
ncbi:hypothetical protein RP20_CCG009206 [Aedes albopictus]|nr:hypothetical protein RP20_CCG009206 [Aedes albopictus]